MATQYDAIGSSYNPVNDLPSAHVALANVRRAVEPLVKGARVLDLACGTGFYSLAALEWGAKEVVGVDISSSMIEDAKAQAAKAGVEDRCTFLVGDGSKRTIYEGGQFDIVTATWLLNYAKDQEHLTEMFKNVSANLKDGGKFFSLQMPQYEEPMEYLERTTPEFGEKYGDSIRSLMKVDDGYHVQVTCHTKPQHIEFDAYHLRQSILEQSAQAGGMHGPLQYLDVIVPDEMKKTVEEGFWDQYQAMPTFGMLVVSK
ncbi:hypothetical protein MMC16_005337 [Acarospora aff. strigata]|nr:hypothetical protein [Acarospora aff. strigata]